VGTNQYNFDAEPDPNSGLGKMILIRLDLDCYTGPKVHTVRSIYLCDLLMKSNRLEVSYNLFVACHDLCSDKRPMTKRAFLTCDP